MPYSSIGGTPPVDISTDGPKQKKPGLFAKFRATLRGNGADPSRKPSYKQGDETPSGPGITVEYFAAYEPVGTQLSSSSDSWVDKGRSPVPSSVSHRPVLPAGAKTDATVKILFPSHFAQAPPAKPANANQARKSRSSELRASRSTSLTLPCEHLELVGEMLHTIAGHDSYNKTRILLNGCGLSLGEFVAISRFGAYCEPHFDCKAQVDKAHEKLMAQTSTDISTGGPLRSNSDVAQQALTGFLCGIMPDAPGQSRNGSNADFASTIAQMHTLPLAWVRAAMLLKLNSLLRASSGLSWDVVETLTFMLDEELTPLVPSQGSISANGDTSLLSYVALAMTGNPNVSVLKGRGEASKTYTGAEALRVSSIDPMNFSAQELHSLTTGTSVSCSVVAHSLADVHALMLLAQLVVSASAEVMMSSRVVFDTLNSDQNRLHTGQTEIANNVRSFLSGSQFTHLEPDTTKSALVRCLQLALQLPSQDATMFATAAMELFPQPDGILGAASTSLQSALQWLGPPLEDLMHAHNSLNIEMNTCTDQISSTAGSAPLALASNTHALAVTNASEKIRDVVAHVGKVLHASHEEIVATASPTGLPSHLSLADPSVEVGFKGVSIGCAALASELGFQATRSSHFAQPGSSDGGNLSSLALISARSTASSVETLTKLVCNAMLMVCQALDVRTCFIAHLRLLATEVSLLLGLSEDVFGSPGLRSEVDQASNSNVAEDKAIRRQMLHKLVAVVGAALMRHTSSDAQERANIAAQHGARAMIDFKFSPGQKATAPPLTQSEQVRLPEGVQPRPQPATIGRSSGTHVESRSGHTEKGSNESTKTTSKAHIDFPRVGGPHAWEKDSTGSGTPDSLMTEFHGPVHGKAQVTRAPAPGTRSVRRQSAITQGQGLTNDQSSTKDRRHIDEHRGKQERGQAQTRSEKDPHGSERVTNRKVSSTTTGRDMIKHSTNGNTLASSRSSTARSHQANADDHKTSKTTGSRYPQNSSSERGHREAQPDKADVHISEKPQAQPSAAARPAVPTALQTLLAGVQRYSRAHDTVPDKRGSNGARTNDTYTSSNSEYHQRDRFTPPDGSTLSVDGKSSHATSSERSTAKELPAVPPVAGRATHRNDAGQDASDTSQGQEGTENLAESLEPVLAHIILRTFERSRDAYFQASRQSLDEDRSEANERKTSAGRSKAPTDNSRDGKLPTSPLPFLGSGSAALYRFVRLDLGLKMHRSAALDQPSVGGPAGYLLGDQRESTPALTLSTSLSRAPARDDKASRRPGTSGTTRSSTTRAIQQAVSQVNPQGTLRRTPSTRPQQETPGQRQGLDIDYDQQEAKEVMSSTGSAQGHGNQRGASRSRQQSKASEDISDEVRRTLGEELSLLYEALRSPRIILDAFEGVLPC